MVIRNGVMAIVLTRVLFHQGKVSFVPMIKNVLIFPTIDIGSSYLKMFFLKQNYFYLSLHNVNFLFILQQEEAHEVEGVAINWLQDLIDVDYIIDLTCSDGEDFLVTPEARPQLPSGLFRFFFAKFFSIAYISLLMG